MGEPISLLERREATRTHFHQESGRIDACVESGYLVGGRVARRAASCLVEPAVGDEALLAVSEDGRLYVLALLERASPETTTIQVEGDLALRSASGRVELSAKDGIGLTTPGDLRAGVGAFQLQADEAALFVRSLAYAGRDLVGRVRTAKLAGDKLDGVWQTVTAHARRVYRTVTESEHVRAGNLDTRCDGAIIMHADSTSITSEKLTKMDAAQIMMG